MRASVIALSPSPEIDCLAIVVRDAPHRASHDRGARRSEPRHRDAIPGDERPEFSAPDEVELARLAAKGSRQAFGSLWCRHAARIHTMLRRIVGATLCDDVAQEVAVTAFGRLASLRDPERFPAWLHAIARNAARDALARRRRRIEGPLTDDVAARLPAPPLGDPLVAREILAAIDELPTCHRAPLRLRLEVGLSGPEIAQRLSMTDGSVRVNLCKGMKLLRQQLDPIAR